MKLHEYQAKQLLAEYGLPTPQGILCHSAAEARRAVANLGGDSWVAKCQVHSGGRGKAGGVKLLRSATAVHRFAQQWLGQRLLTQQGGREGQLVSKILVERVVEVSQELYLAALIDCSSQRLILSAAKQGGVEVECLVVRDGESLHQIYIDPLTGPQPFQGRQLAFNLGLSGHQVVQFSALFLKLAKIVLLHDLTMLEVNPLAITKRGELCCLDVKISVDGNALFRQPELSQLRDWSQLDPREAHSAQFSFSYIALGGDIGCMVNGAGLAMATIDMVQLYGGRAANFLDVGGSATQERVVEAFKLILLDQQVKVILVNIFGGIVRCDSVAQGIIAAVTEVGGGRPTVVRLEGNKSELANKQLAESGLNISVALDFPQAVQMAVAIARGEGHVDPDQ